MKSKMKKLTAMVLAIFMLVSTGIASVAAETALNPTTFLAVGDSISTGYGLEGYTVTDTGVGSISYAPGSFVELLKSEKGFATTNFAQDGMSSSMLATMTNPQGMPPQRMPIFQASKIISITIGGNDLLGALYTAMAAAMGGTLNPGTPEGLAGIQAAVIAGATGSNPQMAGCLAAAIGTVSAALPSLATSFGNNLMQIVTNLKTLNPTATVFVQTIANPYKSVPGVDALVGVLDAAVNVLNTVIVGGAQTGAYRIADVYTAFKSSSEVLTNATNPLMLLDPHPNAAGHKVIADLVFAQTHIWASDFTVDQAATCVADGSKSIHCTTCSMTKDVTAIPATGQHAEGEWIVDKTPSVTAEGTRHTICIVCKQIVKTETIAKLPSKETIVDSITGTKVEYADGTPMDENITFVLTPKSKIEMNSFRDSIDKVAKGFVLTGLYDMKLLEDGAEIQPNGKVKITIPLIYEMKNLTDMQLVFIDDNGIATVIPSEVIDGNIVFTTDHFGSFGVIGKPTSANPKTGDTFPIQSIVLLAIGSAGAFLVISKKRFQSR